MQKKFLVGDQAAAHFLHVHRATIIKLKKQGRIPYTRVGHSYLYDPDELLTFFYHPGKEAEK